MLDFFNYLVCLNSVFPHSSVFLIGSNVWTSSFILYRERWTIFFGNIWQAVGHILCMVFQKSLVDSLICRYNCKQAIDLSVSPSPRTQTSQWQSSISCTGSGTRTSLGFSAIEKHWKIRSSHRFYGVYASKMEKRCAWGTCNTDSRYPERMGNIIYFITFPESKQNSKMSLSIQPQYKWRQKRSFLVVIHSLSYNFNLLKQNVNVILCFSKVSLAKTS